MDETVVAAAAVEVVWPSIMIVWVVWARATIAPTSEVSLYCVKVQLRFLMLLLFIDRPYPEAPWTSNNNSNNDAPWRNNNRGGNSNFGGNNNFSDNFDGGNMFNSDNNFSSGMFI